MFLRIAHRVLSISMATVLTLATLGGIEGLSQADTATAQGAQHDGSTQA